MLSNPSYWRTLPPSLADLAAACLRIDDSLPPLERVRNTIIGTYDLLAYDPTCDGVLSPQEQAAHNMSAFVEAITIVAQALSPHPWVKNWAYSVADLFACNLPYAQLS